MANTTAIEWTEATWNPVTGCTKTSPGCKNCYAERMAKRLKAMGQARYRNEFKLTLQPDAIQEPLRWRKPRRVFVCSMSDLFHEDVPFDFIDKVFAVMALCPQHTFQILTKRPGRMAKYIDDDPIRRACLLDKATGDVSPAGLPVSDGYFGQTSTFCWPLSNVWLGTTAENQDFLEKRVPNLRKCPAAVRFVSLEPLLEHVRFPGNSLSQLDWVIVGAESGPNRRPFDLDWLLALVDACQLAGVPLFVKQDSGLTSGMQGRIPDRVWAIKQYPE